jgi:hypothetical protein
MGRIVFPVLALALAIVACCSPCTPPLTAPVSSEAVIQNVYFTDMVRYEAGTEPYETQVARSVPSPASLPEATLTQLFLGPTDAEKTQGLSIILSGTTGFSKFTIDNGIARVYLTGTCNSHGSTYTIANLIFANLKQFPEIKWIKMYDQNGETEIPEGPNNSIPFCLEP